MGGAAGGAEGVGGLMGFPNRSSWILRGRGDVVAGPVAGAVDEDEVEDEVEVEEVVVDDEDEEVEVEDEG